MDTFEMLTLPFGEESSPKLELDKVKLVNTIDEIINKGSLSLMKGDIKIFLDRVLENPSQNPWTCTAIYRNGNVWKVDQDIFINNLQQIFETKTCERTKYYLDRLKASILKIKTGKVNDINLNRWKEYKDVRTDSLWVDKKRDRSGKHMSSYWGNFIPQIPRQMMFRYTKANDYILDTFAGSGTTLIECRRLGRNGIGFELNPRVAMESQALINEEENLFNVKTEVIKANSVKADYKKLLKERNIDKIQMVIMHPPYYDIIRFSEDDDDLSNAKSVEDFLERLEEIAKRSYEVLEKGRYACLVIGDKYHNSEWVPLGFYSMQRVMKCGFSLKSIIIKNFEQTKGKRKQQELWRYRALVGGYYIFKHEYIFVFQRH